MRRVHPVLLSVGCVAAAVGLAISAPAQPATTQPATKPAQTQPAEGKPATSTSATQGAPVKAPENQPPAPPAPPPVPVPDGPVVKTTDLGDGLIAEDLKIGDGYEVKPGGAVVAFYHGTLKADGTKFDSAFERGEPIAFSLARVIEGWQKGVPGMKVGGIRRLIIPSKMGYGERGTGTIIPPNADLVFVIQLVDALQTQDVKEGEGEPADPTNVAVTAFTMRDKDGKVIDKADAAHPYIWIPGEHMGFNIGIEGMKVGGKRIIKVPALMNLTSPVPSTTRPERIPCELEVDLIALRNLSKMRR